MAEDALLAELQALRDKVAGLTGTAVASMDGLIVREDTGGGNPGNLAALAAAWLSISQRMSNEAGQGTLREAMTRGSGGSVTIYAISGRAVLVLIGDEGLDTARLRRECQPTLDTIRTLISGDSPRAQARLADRERDGVQRQPPPGTDHGPVDADELQVAPEQQLQLGRRLGGVPALDGPGHQ